MARNRKTLNENEVRTVLAVFGELRSMKYDDLVKIIGSITIEEMVELHSKLSDWYNKKVCGLRYDPECGWYDPNDVDHYDPEDWFYEDAD